MDDAVAINMTELPRTVSSESARERNQELDAEMEKVFKPPVKFEMPDTSVEVHPGHNVHFNENDYERHRHMDHHHHHHPLSPLRRNKSFPRMSGGPTDRPHSHHHHHSHHSHHSHHHPTGRSGGLADRTEISPIAEGETETDGGETAGESQVRVVIEEVVDDDEKEEEEAEEEAKEEVKEEKEAEIKKEEPRRNIPKFIIGDPDQDDDGSVHIEVPAEPDTAQAEEKESKKHRHHHHHHHRHHHRDKDGLTPEDGSHRHHRHHHHKKHSSTDLQELRYRIGSSVNLEGLTRVPTELEEALTLKEADLGEMGIHRLADVPGVHRHRVTRKVSSLIHIGQRSVEQIDKLEMKKTKKEYDHRPHEVFVELDELFRDEGHDMQWKEKARWIKFEEDVEEGSNRWGKPHVASLTFHSLIELRKRLAMGATLLDLEERNLSDIFHRIVDKMITSDQIPEESTGDVLRALLLKHKHVHDRHGLLKNISSVSLTSMMGSHHHDNMQRNTQSECNFRHLKEGGGILKNMSAISLTGHDKDKLAKHSTEPADMELKYERDVKQPMLMPSREELNISTLEDEAPVGLLQPPPNPHGPPRPLHISRSFARKLDQQRLEGIMRKIPPGAEATTVLVGEVDFLKRPALVFVRLAEGTVLENFSEVPIPVRFVFVLLGPVDSAVDYHEIGRCFSTLMSSENFHETAYSADCMEDLLSAMNEFIDDSVVLPAGNWDKDLLLPILRTQNIKMRQRRKLKDAFEEEEEEDQEAEELMRREVTEVDHKVKMQRKRAKFINPLKRTGCLFGGLVNDIKRRYPWYLSDLRDSLNLQCFASVFFIFFACLSPAITFGGLLADKTGNLMGVTEMILGTSICGVVFALTAGQPLIIIGATGPLLVFEENLYSFCVANGIEFLPFRAWVGIWIFVICTVTVALEGSVLVRLFTRFTEEIFSFLISLIFIYEVIKKLSKVFSMHPLLESYCFDEMDYGLNTTEAGYTEDENITVATTAGLWLPGNGTDAVNRSACTSSAKDKVNMPNTALLSTLLTLGTFFLAYFLRILRNSRFLGRGARKTIGDFGIPIAIVIMVALDLLVSPTTYTQKLEVPDGLRPTDSCARGWFVNPLGMAQPLPAGLVFAALLPAFLSYILIYMESQITSLIINKKDNKLKKGSGFHVDLFILGVLACVNSFLGLPWMCSATVRSVTHLGSLSIHSKTHAPGERPRLEGVREQRVTSLLVHLFIGLSIALAPLLRQVPLAVLFGVFLYMGIVSLSGLQLVERSKLMFMPVKHHPDVPYTRKVKSFRMHMFTCIQLICLAILWVVKSTPAALAFPFFLILLLPVRRLMESLFSASELDALDNEETEVDPEDEDEYQTHMPV